MTRAQSLHGDICAGLRPVVHVGFDEVNTSTAFIPKSMLPMLEILLTMLNVLVPTKVREAMIQFRFLPAERPEAAAALLNADPALDHPLMGGNTALRIVALARIENNLRSRQFPKVV
jgi:hypothetical protein